jgi:hypothetical protein
MVKINLYIYMEVSVSALFWGTVQRRKVAGSITDEVIDIFHWLNPSDRSMALGVDSASNACENQEYFLGGR